MCVCVGGGRGYRRGEDGENRETHRLRKHMFGARNKLSRPRPSILFRLTGKEASFAGYIISKMMASLFETPD